MLAAAGLCRLPNRLRACDPAGGGLEPAHFAYGADALAGPGALAVLSKIRAPGPARLIECAPLPGAARMSPETPAGAAMPPRPALSPPAWRRCCSAPGSAQKSRSPRFHNCPAPRGTGWRRSPAFSGRRRTGIALCCNAHPPPPAPRSLPRPASRDRTQFELRGSAAFRSNRTVIQVAILPSRSRCRRGAAGAQPCRRARTTKVQRIGEFEELSASKDGEWHRIRFAPGAGPRWAGGSRGVWQRHGRHA